VPGVAGEAEGTEAVVSVRVAHTLRDELGAGDRPMVGYLGERTAQDAQRVGTQVGGADDAAPV
jgi:hypothetical protein